MLVFAVPRERDRQRRLGDVPRRIPRRKDDRERPAALQSLLRQADRRWAKDDEGALRIAAIVIVVILAVTVAIVLSGVAV